MAVLAGWTLLAFGALGALCGIAGAVRWGRQDGLAVVWFTFGLLGSEFVAAAIPLGLAGSAALAALGALQTVPGRSGGGLVLVALATMAVSLVRARGDHGVLEQALRDALGVDYRRRILPERAATLRPHVGPGDWLRPLHYRRDGIETVRDIAYGPHGVFNRLDIVRPAGPVGTGRPVLLHIHGGAWVIGEKQREALPLIRHLAQRGWVVATINYRLSPAAKWPAHLVDAKRALGWLRGHVAEYGGDPDFIAVTGGSAGGHLASLIALTPNRPEFQPGFEDLDTRVQAAVPHYGKYDFLDREGLVAGSPGFIRFLVDKVMPCPPEQDPALWDGASPTQQVHADAPPVFVLQGTHDCLIFVQEARAFVRRLRAVARRPVAYAELHGAQHAFDLVHSLRTEAAVDAVQRFLEFCRSEHLRARDAASATAHASPNGG